MSKNSFEGLPPQFVTSLKILFDILDERKSGFVKLRDLETRWDEGSVEYLPVGVIEALRKVSPANGELSFDRFVAGLRMSLLRHRTEKQSVKLEKTSNKHMRNYISAPSVGHAENAFNANGENSNHLPSMQHRTSSMPLLQHNSGNEMPLNNGVLKLGESKHIQKSLTTPADLFKNSEVLNLGSNNYKNRRPGDGRSSIASASALEFMNNRFMKENDEDDLKKQGTNRRREPRRHTLANGVDHNMIKRLKQFEQEKQILTQGLEMIEKTKNWYGEQLSNVDDKMKYIGRSDTRGDPSLEASEERLNLQNARIQELNQQLRALIDSSHKGFALHMNLAVTKSPHRNDVVEKENVISMLKTQNRLLTKEVSEKSEKIAQLEKEKTQLIRKMFEATSEKHRTNYDDTTFI